ncbi:MAG: hypothetical protein WA766_11485 [Candidatus Acidiferrales bacterium]
MKISEIFSINSPAALIAARDKFEEDLNVKIAPLVAQLESNVLSSDVASIETHMAFIESWRSRLVKYHSLASAFCDHAKDSTFLADKGTSDGHESTPSKKLSELERDAYRRKLAGGFSALQALLEGYIDSIDSRVNLSKKVLGIEVNDTSSRRKTV